MPMMGLCLAALAQGLDTTKHTCSPVAKSLCHKDVTRMPKPLELFKGSRLGSLPREKFARMNAYDSSGRGHLPLV